MAEELVLGNVGHQMVECLGEQPVRRGEFLLAVTEQDAGSVGEGRSGALRHQGRLSHARLPRDEQHPTPLPVDGTLHRTGNGLELDRPAHDPDRGTGGEWAREVARLPVSLQEVPTATSTVSTGSASPFSASGRATVQHVTTASAGHGPHHIGSQDLPTLAEGTEPGRLDHRVTEVVGILAGDLSPTESDP